MAKMADPLDRMFDCENPQFPQFTLYHGIILQLRFQKCNLQFTMVGGADSVAIGSNEWEGQRAARGSMFSRQPLAMFAALLDSEYYPLISE
ncbi:hypothetical protein STEG23_023343, partial [Scotinomys teguina]